MERRSMPIDDRNKGATNRMRQIIKLRLAVGLLGEKEHEIWWGSMWLTNNASAFLAPVYGDRLAPARYQGVVEAARRVHDDRVGVGQAFHLFRLPEGLERTLHEAVIMDSACGLLAENTSAETAMDILADFSPKSPDANPGPVWAGNPKDIQGGGWIPVLAGHYRAAFSSSIQTFPYFSERQ